MDGEAALRRISETFLARARSTRPEIPAGAFAVFIDELSDLFYLNNAIPTRTPRESDVREMIRVFREHNRKPRMEIFPTLFPSLPKLLERSGFTVEAQYPAMVCPKQELRPYHPPHIQVRVLAPEDDFTEYFAIGNEAFDVLILATPERIAQTREQVRDGVLSCAVAFIDGQAAASAATTPFRGVCELAGVGTRPQFLRRGAARAVSSVLLEEHFKTGDLAWLSAGDNAAHSLYEKLGFKQVGMQVNYSIR